MGQSQTFIRKYLRDVVNIADTICIDDIKDFIKTILYAKKNGGRIFIAGVGGSAANASHCVNDFRKILGIEAYSISENVSELTARINDESWKTCYSEYLKVSKMTDYDVLMVLSVGGGSEKTSSNIVEAMRYAKRIGAHIVSIVSRNGGEALVLSDVCVMIPIVEEELITPHAEEWQGIIWHLVTSYLKSQQHLSYPSLKA